MGNFFDRLFKWVWRLTGLALLIIVLIVLVPLSLGVANYINKPQQKVSQVAGTTIDAKKLRLLPFSEITGTTFLYARLGEEGSALSSGSYIENNTSNILFFDTKEKKAHWLIAGNDQRIYYFSFIKYPSHNSPDLTSFQKQTTTGILFSIKTAPGQDGASAQDLFIADANGKNVKLIAKGIDSILSYNQPSDDNFLVFYLKDGVAKVIDYKISDHTVSSDSVIALQQQ